MLLTIKTHRGQSKSETQAARLKRGDHFTRNCREVSLYPNIRCISAFRGSQGKTKQNKTTLEVKVMHSTLIHQKKKKEDILKV